MKIKGWVALRVYDKAGTLKHSKYGPNLVTTVGLREAAELIAGVATVVPSHIAIGESGVDPTLSQTALQGTEHDRRAVAVSQVADAITFTANDLGTGIGGTVTVREAGLFNDGVAGDMFARFLTGEFTLDPGEIVSIAWTITLE